VRPGVVLAADRFLGELLGQHPRDLSARVHFMGALGDADFLAGMALCDAVVFPYLEVGQSSSGPISQALELGCRIIASRTHTFLGFGEYHRDAIEFFDIGNHLELAERLLAAPQFPVRTGLPEYNVETNKAVYLLANSRLPQQRTASSSSHVSMQVHDS
jgi:glycosyltransferase involved in cell wall biosynthesis